MRKLIFTITLGLAVSIEGTAQAFLHFTTTEDLSWQKENVKLSGKASAAKATHLQIQ